MKKRIVGTRKPKKAILIVCEGAKTEPLYFRAFKLASVEVEGAGKNTKSLVEHAARLRDESGGYERCWCVFDRDSFSAKSFNAALQAANNAGIGVAYSNEAFELWYLLHFDYMTSALSRTLYAEKLTERLGRPYNKSDPALYEALLTRQPSAIRNAQRLLATYTPHRPESDNPSTTVHLLVEELNAVRLSG